MIPSLSSVFHLIPKCQDASQNYFLPVLVLSRCIWGCSETETKATGEADRVARDLSDSDSDKEPNFFGPIGSFDQLWGLLFVSLVGGCGVKLKFISFNFRRWL